MYRHWHIAVLAGVLASAGALADDSQYGPVGGDTLWTVAGKVNAQRRLGTTAQVAWALYLKNPQAFDGSPAKVKPAAMLAIPDAATVTAVTNKDAYARLMAAPAAAPQAPPAGAAGPSVAAGPQPGLQAEPRPQPKAQAMPSAAPVRRADPHAPPLVTTVNLKPARSGTQWLSVRGENFRPGATLELRDMLGSAVFSAQAPARISATQIDYEAKVGNTLSNWLVTVRNADGTRSEGFGFAAGPGAPSAGPDPAAMAAAEAKKRAEAEQAAARDAAAAQEAEQASHLQREQERLAAEAAAMQKAGGKPASSAELDREFEEKMAADRAAYEKAEAAKKARAKKK